MQIPNTIVQAGGLTQTYVGYNTIGGTYETLTTRRVYAKKITVASAGLITSIEAYVQNDAAGADDQVESLSVVLHEDVAGTPGMILACSMGMGITTALGTGAPGLLFDSAAGAGGDGTPRWFGLPLGRWVTAGDYWIAVSNLETSTILQMPYDAGGDRYYTSGGSWFADWGFYAPSTTANSYSIRASVIR